MGLPRMSLRTFSHSKRQPLPSPGHLSPLSALTHTRNAMSLQTFARLRSDCQHFCTRCQRILGRACFLFLRLTPVLFLRTGGVLFRETSFRTGRLQPQGLSKLQPTRVKVFRSCGGFTHFLFPLFLFCLVSCWALFFRRVLIKFTEKSLCRRNHYSL